MRKPIIRLAEQGKVVARDQQFRPARQVVAGSHLARSARHTGAPDPNPKKPHSKLIAVALALLFGYFGAHLFYLGQRRQALFYLGATLFCLALMAVLFAITPVASISSGFIILALLLLAIGGVFLVYLHALLDAVRIIFSSSEFMR
jgi:TM2 domain-containing membrane protein YozV